MSHGQKGTPNKLRCPVRNWATTRQALQPWHGVGLRHAGIRPPRQCCARWVCHAPHGTAHEECGMGGMGTTFTSARSYLVGTRQAVQLGAFTGGGLPTSASDEEHGEGGDRAREGERERRSRTQRGRLRTRGSSKAGYRVVSSNARVHGAERGARRYPQQAKDARGTQG